VGFDEQLNVLRRPGKETKTFVECTEGSSFYFSWGVGSAGGKKIRNERGGSKKGVQVWTKICES